MPDHVFNNVDLGDLFDFGQFNQGIADLFAVPSLFTGDEREHERMIMEVYVETEYIRIERRNLRKKFSTYHTFLCVYFALMLYLILK